MKNSGITTTRLVTWKRQPGEQDSPIFKLISSKKIYTVADTSLSYRKIYLLDEDRLLAGNRPDKRSWRKFDFKELIFLALIDEFRKYGLEKKQLRGLKSTFFGKDSKSTESAIQMAVRNHPVQVVLDDKGVVRYLDGQKGNSDQLRLKSFVCVNLTTITHDVIARVE